MTEEERLKRNKERKENYEIYEKSKEAFFKGDYTSAFDAILSSPNKKEGVTYYIPAKYNKEE